MITKDRKRVRSTKVRTGCESCKSRHVRCSEEKPTCYNCCRRGAVCEYKPPKVWLFQSSVPSHHSSQLKSLNSCPQGYLSPPVTPGSPKVNARPAQDDSLSHWTLGADGNNTSFDSTTPELHEQTPQSPSTTARVTDYFSFRRHGSAVEMRKQNNPSDTGIAQHGNEGRRVYRHNNLSLRQAKRGTSGPQEFVRSLSARAICEDERKALICYGQQLVDVFPTSMFQEFWFDIIPEYAQAVPAIHHLLVAIGMRQEIMLKSSSCDERLSALEKGHYLRALSLLSTFNAQHNSEVILLSCCLLIVYDMLQGFNGTGGPSLEHLLAGFDMVREQSAKGIPSLKTRNITEECVKPVFLSLGLIFSAFLDPPDSIAAVIHPLSAKKPQAPPEMFTDLSEARESFVQICRWRYTGQLQAQEPWTEHSSHFEEVKTLLTNWHDAFDRYEQRLSKSDHNACIAHQNLQMQCRTLSNSMIYSASDKLTGVQKTRPVAVDVSQADRIFVTYRISPSACDQIKRLDWSPQLENAPMSPAIWDTRVRQNSTGGPLFIDLVIAT